MLRNAKTEFSALPLSDTKNLSFQSLTKGINSHIDIDKRFHNSTFFLENTKLFATKIRSDNEISMNRYTQFYAHILLELLIDHWLIVDNVELLDIFYESLAKVERSEVENYFSAYFPAQDFELFWEKHANFKETQYLRDYSSLDKVVGFSFYVYQRATKQTVETRETSYYISIISDQLFPVIEKGARNLFTNLSK